MDSLEQIRQSVLDHDAPSAADLGHAVSRVQRRNVIIVLAMVIGAFLVREITATWGVPVAIIWLLSALLSVWAIVLVIGMLLQPFVKARYERRVLAHVGATELEEVARLIERLRGIAPVVERWMSNHGGLRRLEYDVLHRASLALSRLEEVEVARQAKRSSRAHLGRVIDENSDSRQ